MTEMVKPTKDLVYELDLATAEALVCLWVNERKDRGAALVGDRVLGQHVPDVCPDLVGRIVKAIGAAR
jgi:hypothetical protein